MRLSKFKLAMAVYLITATQPMQAQAADANVTASEIRAQLTAKTSTTLSAEISAAVKQLSLREGDRFNKGDLLVVFDCSIQQAQLQKAEATINGATKTFEVNSRLSQLESVSNLDVEVARAKLGEAKADVALTHGSTFRQWHFWCIDNLSSRIHGMVDHANLWTVTMSHYQLMSCSNYIHQRFGGFFDQFILFFGCRSQGVTT